MKDEPTIELPEGGDELDRQRIILAKWNTKLTQKLDLAQKIAMGKIQRSGNLRVFI